MPIRYHFTGQEYDADIGLHYYRARWYSTELGRFVSEDPIGFDGGDVNLYGYVRNNPSNFIDPIGTEVFVILYRSKGKLTVDKYSKHWFWGTDQVEHHEFNVFSGMRGSFCMNSNRCDTAEDEGPIPRGQYLIDDKPNVNSTEPWQQISYRLSRSKNTSRPWSGPFGRPGEYVPITDPFTGETVSRGGFYIHPGTVSQGCITFPKTSILPNGAPWSPDYERFDKIMKDTTPYLYNNQKFGGRLLVID
jgi:RHS repeat-associated protein